MATVTGLTAEKMLELAGENVVDAAIVDDRLIFTKRDGTTIDAGIVKGSAGSPGPSGVGPTGSVTMFAGASAPSGHLLCDGSPVSRSTYSTLFGVVGTTYGAGDGSTTFNLPNLKGKIPVGLDAAQTEFDALGETGGAKTHTLSAAEMPIHTHVQTAHTHIQNSHNHTQNSHNHTQTAHDHTQGAHNHAPGILSGYMTYGTVSRSRVAAGTSTSPIAITATDTTQLGVSLTVTSDTIANNTSTTAVNAAVTPTNDVTTATSQTTTAVNQNAGSGSAHNNLQPYIVMNYIIKI